MQHLFQKLSLLLMRGNSALLINRVPVTDDDPEVGGWEKTFHCQDLNLYLPTCIIFYTNKYIQLSHLQVYALDVPEELGGKETRIADLVIGTYPAIGARVKHPRPNTTFTSESLPLLLLPFPFYHKF